MINLLLILLLIHYILYYFNSKNKNNILSCGLFGWVGENTEDFNKDKFDKLGIYNITRGRHSCGVAIDGNLTKGINKTALYDNFIVNNTLNKPKESAVVIGHTRQATIGAHTENNAHPFKFDYGEEGYFIGAHNGTLVNHKDLAKKYGVSDTGIDSKILLEIISKDDENINVLSEYYGAAALLFHSSDNKNTLYFYRGKSIQKDIYYEKEERPLFYWQQSENSMYISSLKDSLLSIIDSEEDKKNIFEVTPNRVYEVTNGKITAKYEVDRSKAKSNYEKALSEKYKNTNNSTNSRVSNNAPATTYVNNNSDLIKKDINLFYEKDIIRNHSSLISFSNLRFRDNDVLLEGIYVFIEDIGYAKLCDNLDDVDKCVKDYVFVDNSFNPPQLYNFNSISDASLFFFYEGVMLDTPYDYQVCKNPEMINLSKVGFRELAEMSRYPIIDISRKTENKEILYRDQNITKGNKNYTGTIKIPGTYCEYIISNGVVQRIRTLQGMYNYDSSIYNILDPYDCEEYTDKDDVEDTSFASNIKNSLDNTDVSFLDDLFEITTNFQEAIEGCRTLKNLYPNNKLAILLEETGDNINNTLHPILNSISEYTS